jgi:hypothetical protein
MKLRKQIAWKYILIWITTHTNLNGNRYWFEITTILIWNEFKWYVMSLCRGGDIYSWMEGENWFFFSKNGVQTVNNNNFLKLQQLADMAMRTNHRTTSAASIKCNVYQPKAKIVLLTRMKMQMLFSGKVQGEYHWHHSGTNDLLMLYVLQFRNLALSKKQFRNLEPTGLVFRLIRNY